jgi:uncharacterized protein YecE (DUF72 family)
MASTSSTGRIRLGIGGWNYEPWHTTFYPPGTSAKDELRYASRQLGTIEVNGTFYRTQKPDTFAKWYDETPEDFVFALKAVRYTTQKKVLAEAGESVQFFLRSGLSELRHKLGPILWQFAPTKRFDEEDFEAFARLLPRELDGLPLRHVMEVRHASFLTPAFLELLRRHRFATVITDSPDYPSFANLSTDFVYLRLMRAAADVETGYPPDVLDTWAACAQAWAAGGEPANVPRIEGDTWTAPDEPRDVFMLMINGAKEHAPRAAMEVIRRLPASPEPSA